jgi:hypothetical protein
VADDPDLPGPIGSFFQARDKLIELIFFIVGNVEPVEPEIDRWRAYVVEIGRASCRERV